jgi:small subunit ribosomal protein S7
MKIFGLYDPSEVTVEDPGLKDYINLKGTYVPHSAGRFNKPFGKTEVSIVERLINRLQVTGHDGKKHRRSSGRNTGKKHLTYNIVKEAFAMVHKRTKKNPIQVLVDAVSKASPREETTRLKYGGIAYHQSVDVAPQRRLDIALKLITVGAARAAFKSKKSLASALADELIKAANYDTKCFSISKKEEIERISKAAR